MSQRSTTKRAHWRWGMLAGLGLVAAGLAGAVTPVSGQATNPVPGPWAGMVSFSLDNATYTMPIAFTVDPGGMVTGGAIRLAFTYPDIPDALQAAIEQHGCLVPFDTFGPNSQPIAGLFGTPQDAVGIFQAASCQLEGFGELQFVTPLAGTWSATPDAGAGSVAVAAGPGAASPTTSPYDPPTHVNDNLDGRALYNLHCEECHAQKGLGSEKAPPLEGLNAQKIAETVRDGPEDMDVFTHDELPDRQLNVLIDYVLRFHPDSTPRTEFVITPPTTE